VDNNTSDIYILMFLMLSHYTYPWKCKDSLSSIIQTTN